MDEEKRPLLYNYFLDTANLMLSEYNRSKSQNASTNKGKNREIFCSDFLKKVLPTKLRVVGGEIWDSDNKKTGQLDIIIVRDDAPSLTFGEVNTYLSEGIFSVIEVKSFLDQTKLDEAHKTLQKVGSLKINIGATISSGATLNRPLRVLFSYDGNSLESVVENIIKNGYNESFDLICILTKGVIMKKGLLLKWSTEHEFSILRGKAVALGLLYNYLVSYGSGFLGRTIILQPYFEPINRWDEEK